MLTPVRTIVLEYDNAGQVWSTQFPMYRIAQEIRLHALNNWTSSIKYLLLELVKLVQEYPLLQRIEGNESLMFVDVSG